jgi:NAD(P)-dependent dehydrogenase (short-subunit alcohol dehydrogenase family)
LSNILVTGAAGLVGAALLRRLAADGHALVTTDARKADVPVDAPFEVADLTDRAALAALFQKHTIDTVMRRLSGPIVAADNLHLVAAVGSDCIDGDMGPLDFSRASAAFGYAPQTDPKSGHRVLRRKSGRGSLLTDPKWKRQAFC